ncbi:MAG: HDOD domain-containing protein [Kofleriaceae bacterium]
MTDRLRHILFVDDDPRILSGLRNGLRRHRACWDMAFADSGQAALLELETKRFDVVVSDMRMPQMDGVELFETVRSRYPQTARIILTGYAEHGAIARIFAVAHQLLSKPCPSAVISSAIERACELHDVLSDPATCAVMAQIPELPGPPRLYFDIALTLAYPEIPIADIAATLANAPDTCARLLELCTPQLGFDHPIENAEQAITHLGPELIGPLVLAAHAWTTIGSVADISPLGTRHHGIDVARLAATSSDRGQASDAFAAGLVHDIGKLLLARYLPAEHASIARTARDTGVRAHVAEQALLGTTHAAIGANLMARWGIALPIIDAIARHHSTTTVDALAATISNAHRSARSSRPPMTFPHPSSSSRTF